MPRNARKKSESGIYHIMMRGINRQNIFEDDDDRQKLLDTIKQYKPISKYQIYGYCLMSNHVHLLMRETTEPLSLAIKRICGSYVYWYNWKYERCGHLFQERYKSETVNDGGSLLTVLRYILQNPVNAGLTKSIKDFKWSSYKEYLGQAIMTDVDIVLEILSNDKKTAVGQFEKYMNEYNEERCLEYEERHRLTDNEVRSYFSIFGILSVSELQQLDRNKRDDIIKKIKLIDGVTIRQLSRITGISKSVIDRV